MLDFYHVVNNNFTIVLNTLVSVERAAKKLGDQCVIILHPFIPHIRAFLNRSVHQIIIIKKKIVTFFQTVYLVVGERRAVSL